MKYECTDRKIIYRKVDNCGLILDVDLDRIFQLSDVGSFIWEIIKREHIVAKEDIIQEIICEYNGITPDEIETDISFYLDDLIQFELISKVQ